MTALTRSTYDLDSPRGEHWSERALCRLDPELWWSGRGPQRALARHLCLAHCPVLEACAAALGDRPRPRECVIAGEAHGQRGRPLFHLPERARCPYCD